MAATLVTHADLVLAWQDKSAALMATIAAAIGEKGAEREQNLSPQVDGQIVIAVQDPLSFPGPVSSTTQVIVGNNATG